MSIHLNYFFHLKKGAFAIIDDFCIQIFTLIIKLSLLFILYIYLIINNNDYIKNLKQVINNLKHIFIHLNHFFYFKIKS